MNVGKRMAILASKKSPHPKYQIGAALIDGPRIIAAYNQDKTAPFTESFYSHSDKIHAEAALFGRADRGEYAGSTVYVYRALKNGDPADALPCPCCRELLRWHGIKKVVHSTPLGWVTYKLA